MPRRFCHLSLVCSFPYLTTLCAISVVLKPLRLTQPYVPNLSRAPSSSPDQDGDLAFK